MKTKSIGIGPSVIWDIYSMRKIVKERGMNEAVDIIAHGMFTKKYVRSRLKEFCLSKKEREKLYKDIKPKPSPVCGSH